MVSCTTSILTGILGNMLAPFLCRAFGLRHSVAWGIAIGTASHAIGTTRALEMGDIEGAMSGLAIAVAGNVILESDGLIIGFLFFLAK